MAFFNFFRKRGLFHEDEQRSILESINEAEINSSGEIRIYVESRCQSKVVIERAAKVFEELEMGKTQSRNAVLIYVALKDKKYAIYGDSGIYEKFGTAFWENKVLEFKKHFQERKPSAAICEIIKEIGITLKEKFPHAGDEDVNELPNEVVFGN